MEGPFDLDGRKVPIITAYLFHAGGHENPATLAANAGKSFIGSYILGMGFTFDDTDRKGVASPLSEMERVISKNPRNAERIFPYIGGEEVNNSSTHAHHRYVIDFGERDEREARLWPDLWRILEERVKPERITKDGKKYPRMVYEWWKYWNSRPELYGSIRDKGRCLAISRVGQYICFAFLPVGMVYADSIVVFPVSEYSFFCFLQSRIHEIWARFFASSLEDRLRYTPSDCFETFPMPEGWESNTALDSAGREYYEFRAALMSKGDEGFTKTYNLFHDQEENSPDILKLRELHAAMDRVVLDAYGWPDMPTTYDFLLDYEEEEEENADGGPGRRRKKPWRYRWPDDIRDEVLARLLALNAKRAEEERLTARAASIEAPHSRRGRKPKKNGSPDQGKLL